MNDAMRHTQKGPVSECKLRHNQVTKRQNQFDQHSTQKRGLYLVLLQPIRLPLNLSKNGRTGHMELDCEVLRQPK